MKRLIILKFVILLSSVLNSNKSQANCNGVWDIWIIPEKYVISKDDSLVIRFGITGFGDLDIYKSKFCIYSEKETLIKMDGDNSQYEIYISILEPRSLDSNTIYNTKNKSNIVMGIGLKSDYLTEFNDIITYPKTTGDKRLKFIFTYDCAGEWKTISKEFNYHVNTWTEDNEGWLNIVYLFVAILTILTFTPNNFISNFFKRIISRMKKTTPQQRI